VKIAVQIACKTALAGFLPLDEDVGNFFGYNDYICACAKNICVSGETSAAEKIALHFAL
jgi:hypothetical protein